MPGETPAGCASASVASGRSGGATTSRAGARRPAAASAVRDGLRDASVARSQGSECVASHGGQGVAPGFLEDARFMQPETMTRFLSLRGASGPHPVAFMGATAPAECAELAGNLVSDSGRARRGLQATLEEPTLQAASTRMGVS